MNASRKPGEWQTYDVIWTEPTFNADGLLKTPAYVTAFHNGILVQNHVELKGETVYIGKPEYKKYGLVRQSSCRRTGIPAPPSASAISGCESSRSALLSGRGLVALKGGRGATSSPLQPD